MNNLEQEKEFLVEIDGQKFIDITKILPETLPSGKRIIWKEVEDGKVLISVDKHSARGGNAKPIKIKRLIEVNDDLFELFGLIIGDGIKKQATENTLGFSNTEIFLQKEFLEKVENVFGIKRIHFKCNLQLTSKLFQDEKQIKRRISKELCIPLDNFWKSRINEKRNTVGIDIRTDSRLWGVVLRNLLDLIKSLALQDKKFAAKMLQGIIASEANIHVRNDSGRLGEISIAAKEGEKRGLIRQLLLTLGIQPNKDKIIEHQESVLIHGLSNFKKVKENGLVMLHPQKLEAFERGMKGFKKEQSRKGELRLKVLELLKEKPRTRKELGKMLNRSPDTVKTEALFILEAQKLVKRGSFNSKARLWEITEKGSKVLKSENVLEKLRNRK